MWTFHFYLISKHKLFAFGLKTWPESHPVAAANQPGAQMQVCPMFSRGTLQPEKAVCV